MASMRLIKGKIKSVKSTQQITKAMNLVAASKLQRAKSRLNDTRPYAAEIKKAIGQAMASAVGVSHPLLEVREPKKSVIIVITGDRGLCGGYNSNICKAAFTHIKENSQVDATAITIGSKSRDYFSRRRKVIRNSFTGISEQPLYTDATQIGAVAIDLFTNKEVDQVFLAYTEFKSTISHEPRVIRLLPVESVEDTSEKHSAQAVATYEPNEATVLDYILPKYIKTVIYGGLVESAACELGARMTSMDTATENASDMIAKYTLQFNRARQGAITQELTEIVSGANALE